MLRDEAATETTGTPGRLAVVESFLNTHAAGGRADVLASPDVARAWLDSIARPSVPVDTASLTRLRELRDALRVTLLAHNGEADAEDAARVLAPICESSTLGLAVGPSGSPEVVGGGSGLDGFVGDVLASVAIASIDGTWSRMRACGDPACRTAFWDGTRNGSRRWCSAAGCANRARQRQFRARQRSGVHE